MIPHAAKLAGIAAEKDARWHLHRAFGKSKNYRVLHDITIPDPHSDSPCQIDHLVIGRFCDFIVIETKSTKGGCSLTKENGAWGRWRNGIREPMRSPIEQNKRHIQCLEAFLEKFGLIPKRGLKAKPNFHNWILVDPGSDVPTKFDGAQIIHRDAVESVTANWIEKNTTSFRNLLNLLTIGQLETIAAAIPARLEDSTTKPEPSNPAWPQCEDCHVPVTQKVQDYCRLKSSELGNKLLCRDCQKTYRDAHPANPIPPPTPLVIKPIGPHCEYCLIPVDDKVVYYCRLKKAELGAKLLCQECQRKHRAAEPVKCAKCSTPVDAKVVAFCRFNWEKMGKQILCKTCQPH